MKHMREIVKLVLVQMQRCGSSIGKETKKLTKPPNQPTKKPNKTENKPTTTKPKLTNQPKKTPATTK